MTLLPLILALGITTDAHAKGKGDEKVGVRLKFNAPLWTQTTTKVTIDGEEPDGFEPTKTSALTLLNGQNRTELTYLLGDGLEVGGLLGYSRGKSVTDGDETGLYSDLTIGVTGAYNFKLGDGMMLFAQPVISYTKTSGQADPDADKAGFKGFGIGADVGLRFNLAKGIHIDPAVEYFRQGFVPWSDADGFENDPEQKLTGSNLGLRLGLGVKF